MATLPLPSITLFGDSLTELSYAHNGLAAQLSALYTRKAVLSNKGLSGYTSRWAIPCFKEWVEKTNEDTKGDGEGTGAKPELMTIWLGANDSALEGELQHVPLAEYTSNLRLLISLLRTPSSPYYRPSLSLLLITPPPIHPPSWTRTRVSRDLENRCDRTNENTRRYAEAVKEVGREEGLPVVDAFEAVWEAAGGREEALEEFFEDGLHLLPKGYNLVVEGVKSVITTHYPHLHWDTLPTLFPYWRDIPTGALGEEFKLKTVGEKVVG